MIGVGTTVEHGAFPETDASRELARLYREHAGRVFRAAYRVTGSTADAEDILQTVFLRLARREEAAVRNAESYLYRAAINAAVDLLRSRKEQSPLPLEDAERARAGPGDWSTPDEAGELRRQLRQALGRLSPRAAEMFALRYFEDYDLGQIARLLQTSQAVVAVTLFRTRQQLQKQLAEFRGGKR